MDNQDKNPVADGTEQATPNTLTDPILEMPESGDKPAPPEMSADGAAALPGEGEKALGDIGEEQSKPPLPSDSIAQKPETAQETEKENTKPDPAAEEQQVPAKKGRGKAPKADKTEKAPDKPDPKNSPEYKKALSDYEIALAEWDSKEPWDRSGEPPQRPKPPKPPKKEKAAPEKPKKAARTPRPPKGPKDEKSAADTAPPAPAEPEQPPVPRDATRNGETEQIVYINLSELRPFKDHPFGVRDDAEMKALVESVKENGVNQPALVRPHPDGSGYEIVAGHRRQMASELAAYANMPCIVRDMTDDEAILAMTDDNLRQRSELLHSEKAASLKMQVDAIKRQGARDSKENDPNKGKTSYDIVAERNSDKNKPMSAKQVQRYVKLTELVPDLMKMLDEKQLGFTQAIEFSFIKRKNQNLIAVSIEGEQAKPSLSQAQKLRQLDKDGQLNGDVIDGILSEEKKEVEKVIISGAELNKYFGKDKTPREMKDQIIKLLDDWADKEKSHTAPEKPER